MRILTASIVIGPLVLAGALPAAAQSTPPSAWSAAVRLAAGDWAADRDTYAHEALDEMQEWKQKLHDFGDKAEAQGKKAGDTAGNDLNRAWTKAEAASRKLQTVGAEGWESAKASYEEASRELTEAWDKFRPKDK